MSKKLKISVEASIILFRFVKGSQRMSDSRFRGWKLFGSRITQASASSFAASPSDIKRMRRVCCISAFKLTRPRKLLEFVSPFKMFRRKIKSKGWCWGKCSFVSLGTTLCRRQAQNWRRMQTGLEVRRRVNLGTSTSIVHFYKATFCGWY
jgi:hypothetical protein